MHAFVRRHVSMLALAALLTGSGPVACSGCEDRQTPPDDSGVDVRPDLDSGRDDANDRRDAPESADGEDGEVDASDASGTTSPTDSAEDVLADAATDIETGPGDTNDVSVDVGTDASDATDTATEDGGSQPPAGLSTACSNGPGWTLFKFHWSHNFGSSPRVDVWDATCRYGVNNNTCTIQRIRNPGFNSRQPKALLVTSGEYLRVRFSVDGLSFSEADVYARARSYSTTSPGKFQVTSPIYGSKLSGLVDNDFTYDWYRVPWTGYLKPSDDPNLTAIDISADSGTVAIHAVEVCVR